MKRSRAAARWLHAQIVGAFPPEFSRRYRDEIRLDFTDDVEACATLPALAVTAGRGYADLVVSVIREWRRHDVLRMLAYATCAHAGIWSIGMAVAAMQWPRGPRLFPLVFTFALLGASGIALTVWRQTTLRRGCCSLRAAELD
jgi:hypothetical protein